MQHYQRTTIAVDKQFKEVLDANWHVLGTHHVIAIL